VFQWPRDGALHVPVGKLRIRRIYLLADLNRTLLKTDKRPDTLVIHVPRKAPDEIVSVIAIEHQ
jgi:alpha-L-fucosidase